MAEIGALSQALSAQSLMGAYVVKVLDQSQQMIQMNMANMANPIAEIANELSSAVDGVGENLDVTA